MPASLVAVVVAKCSRRAHAEVAHQRVGAAGAPAPVLRALQAAPSSRVHAFRAAVPLDSPPLTSSPCSKGSGKSEILSPSPRPKSLSASDSDRNFKPLSPLSGDPDRHQDEEDRDLHFGTHFRHLRRGEAHCLQQPAHMATFPVVQYVQDISLRKDLVTCIMRAHLYCKLEQRTLYLAVAVLDQYFLTQRPVPRSSLLAATSLLVATKFEEELVPETDMLARGLGDEELQQPEIVLGEVELLHAISFQLHRPTPAHHLHWFIEMLLGDTCEEEAKRLNKMTHFLCELGFLSACSGHWAPSLHAAGAALLAAALMKRTEYIWELQRLIAPDEGGHSRQQLWAILKQLLGLLSNRGLQGEIVYRKYLHVDNLNVSFEAKSIISFELRRDQAWLQHQFGMSAAPAVGHAPTCALL